MLVYDVILKLAKGGSKLEPTISNMAKEIRWFDDSIVEVCVS